MGRSKGVVTVVEVCTYMSSDMQPNTFACSMYVRICGGPIMELHSLATVAGAVQCKLHRQDGKCAHCTQCEVVGIALYPVCGGRDYILCTYVCKYVRNHVRHLHKNTQQRHHSQYFGLP